MGAWEWTPALLRAPPYLPTYIQGARREGRRRGIGAEPPRPNRIAAIKRSIAPAGRGTILIQYPQPDITMTRTHRRPLRFVPPLSLVALVAFGAGNGQALGQAGVQAASPTLPQFVDGRAQRVDGFRQGWIQHSLWVETEFDTDGDGRLDRMHVDVTRPGQTDTEGLKVPVIYETSPYYKGTSGGGPGTFWDPKHELGETPPERPHPPAIRFRDDPDSISGSLVSAWVPRGFAVVHSCSPGTGLSQGCPHRRRDQ